MHAMELTLMRSLLAVVDAGAITAAADRVGLTQPALSRRIRQLEEELGVALLSRGRKGVELTAAGELVAAEARVLVARYDGLCAQVAAHQRLEGGTIRLGGGATAVSFVLPPAIADFQRDHPAVRFHLKEAGSREVEQDVVSGRLELGLVTMPVHLRELTVKPLMADRIVLIARAEHPLAHRQQVDVQSLAGMSLVGFEAGSAIRHLIDAALREAGVEMNVVMELRSIPAIVRMVALTGNLAFVSRVGVENERDVRILPVRGLAIRRELAVIARRGVVLSPAAEAFAKRL